MAEVVETDLDDRHRTGERRQEFRPKPADGGEVGKAGRAAGETGEARLRFYQSAVRNSHSARASSSGKVKIQLGDPVPLLGFGDQRGAVLELAHDLEHVLREPLRRRAGGEQPADPKMLVRGFNTIKNIQLAQLRVEANTDCEPDIGPLGVTSGPRSYQQRLLCEDASGDLIYSAATFRAQFLSHRREFRGPQNPIFHVEQ